MWATVLQLYKLPLKWYSEDKNGEGEAELFSHSRAASEPGFPSQSCRPLPGRAWRAPGIITQLLTTEEMVALEGVLYGIVPH